MKILKITIALLFILSSVFAQDKYIIKEVKQTMSKGSQTGLQVTLPNTTTKDVEEAIREVMKPYKTKIDYTDKTKG